MREIRVLGRFEIEADGAVSLPKKAQGLLAYLAMQCGRPVQRDQLAELLWGSSQPELGRHSLRQCLAAVRRALKDTVAVVASGTEVMLAAPCEGDIDAVRFQKLAQSSALPDLVTADKLYRGEFLADFEIASQSFMDWVSFERKRLDGAACDLLRRLALALADAGDPEAAIDAGQRLVGLDPVREDSHRLLMELYDRVGRRAEAIRQFAACNDYLRRELGVAPDKKTIELAEAIRTGAKAPQPVRAPPIAERDGDTVIADVDAGTDVRQTEKPDETTTTARPRHTWGASDPGQFRQITVLAGELVPSLAALSLDAGDPEVLEDGYRRCADIVKRHHGYIARCAGDGLLAYFGYPQAREQDAENAVRAALSLQNLAPLPACGLQPCIGIASGILTITEKDGGCSAIGEPLTLSNRLQTFAKPGQIVIAPSTRLLVGGLFDYQDLGAEILKGATVPLQLCGVVGESNIESRFEALHPAKLTPFVGRNEEIEQLLRRWEQAGNGEGLTVTIVGEAGIGKSRVVQTVAKLLSGETRQSLFCSPHHQDSSLFPFIQYFERAAGFHDRDTAEQRLIKLEQLIGLNRKVLRDGMPLLAELLGIPASDRYPSSKLTPQQRKEKTLGMLAAHVEELAAERPLLLVVEDVHWADPTSLELIDRIVERAPQCRLLLILTARPGFAVPWAGQAHASVITLGRLPLRQSAAVVSGVIEGRQLPETAIKEILDRADGIPLFIEELTKATLESSASEDSIDRHAVADHDSVLNIPMTLHASLLARLDRLETAREVAQAAAALGRRFSYGLLREIVAVSQAHLDHALESLAQAELVWRRGTPPDAEYTFKHALVQDAAYGTLRREPRRALHARIVGVLEIQMPTIAETKPELLAHHCNEAGLIEKAATLWGKAGQLSLARSAVKEAAVQLARALGLIETLEGSKSLRQEQIRLQIALANALMHTKGYAAPETREALARARRLVEQAEARGEAPEDRLLLLSVLHGFWVASHVAFDGDAVRDLSREFMTLAEKQKTVFPLVLGHRLMGTSLLYLGDIVKGREHLDRAMALYDPAEHRALATRFGHDAGVAVISNRSLALWLLGHADAALNDARDAVAQARETGQASSFLYAVTRIAVVHLLIRNYEIGSAQIEELFAGAREIDGSYWTAAATMLQGCLYALTGKGEPAIQLITSGIAASRLKGSNLLRMPWYLSCLSNAHFAAGQIDEARNYIREALAAAEATQESWQTPDLHRMAGDLECAASDREAAQIFYRRALSEAKQQRAKAWELRAATSLARFWRDEKQRRKALDVLAPIYGAFSEGLETPDLLAAKYLLKELR